MKQSKRYIPAFYDNIGYTPGTGATVAADDVGGFLHQRVKISQGADGSATDVSSAAPLQVTLANTGANSTKILTTPDLPTGAATAAKQPALGTAGTSSADVLSVQGRASMTPLAMSDSLGNSVNSSGPGFLKVTDEPTQLFYDPFDAAPDTTNMWTSTTGSSGVAASVATGVLSMGTGTVANGYSKFTSVPTFKPVIPGWVVYSDAINIPDAAAPTANALRLWGAGTTPATPTLAAPITDGYFFELNGSVLSAVVYAGGTRTQIATGLTLATTYQRYIIQVRTDKTYFYIGTIDSAGLVATTSFQSPQVQTLPKLFLAVGNSTPPGANSQILCTGAVVSDSGKNSSQISDATFPWRKMAVGSTGAAAVNNAQTAGTATSVSSGVTDAGTQRVTIASDSTGQVKLAAGTAAVGSLTAGSAVIGKVGIDQTTPGTTNLVALAANQSVNTAQINSVTPLMGNGVTGTGSQRVTVASDNTPFPVKLDQTTPGTTNAVSIAQIGATTVVNGGVAGTLGVGGTTAAAATDAGNPVKTGGVGKTANPIAVTDGQRANFITDKLGKQVVVGSIRDLKTTQATTITASTTETTVLTAVAATFLDVYGVIVSNSSATVCTVAFKDSTAGTTRFNITVPAGETRGFMLPESGAHVQATVNTNWTATCSASVTSINVTMLAVKNI